MFTVRTAKILFASLIPSLLFFAFLGTRPIDQFGFRAWEALTAKGSGAVLLGRFYPMSATYRDEVGDLAPYTPDAVIKPRIVWETDALGFRNSPNRCRRPEVLVVGESMAIGTGVSQEQELSVVLERDLSVCAKNLGGISLERALALMDHAHYDAKVVIYATPERNTRAFSAFNQAAYKRDQWLLRVLLTFTEWRWSKPLAQLIDFIVEPPFHAYKARHGVLAAIARAFADRNHVPLRGEGGPETGRLIPTPRMNSQRDEPARIAEALMTWKEQFASRGATFVLVSVPERELLYDRIAEPVQSPMQPLADALDLRDVRYVDLWRAFRALRSQGIFAHHLDDTHWNAYGIAAASKSLQSLIVARHLLE